MIMMYLRIYAPAYNQLFETEFKRVFMNYLKKYNLTRYASYDSRFIDIIDEVYKKKHDGQSIYDFRHSPDQQRAAVYEVVSELNEYIIQNAEDKFSNGKYFSTADSFEELKENMPFRMLETYNISNLKFFNNKLYYNDWTGTNIKYKAMP